MDERIISFITGQTCASMACANEEGRLCSFSCFYSFDSGNGLLHYKSSRDTRHSLCIAKRPAVAGTILPDKLNRLQIKGVQFEGRILAFDDPLCKQAASHFYKKHPVALSMPGDVWTVQLDFIKFTDNTLGFGKKLSWQREACTSIL